MSDDIWKAEALRRFGPVPTGGGENTRLIAGYHYAFVEGAKSAAARIEALEAVEAKHFAALVRTAELEARNEALTAALRSLTEGVNWKTVDKGNMDYIGHATCYQLETARRHLAPEQDK